MNKKFKKIIPILLPISIYIILLILCVSEYKHTSKYDMDSYNYNEKLCIEEKDVEACEMISLGKPIGQDAYTLYFEFTIIYNLSLIALIGPLMVIIPSLWQLHKEFKSGFYKNQLTRKKYNDYIKQHYKRSLKFALLIPSLLVFTFLICLLITKNLDNSDVSRGFIDFMGKDYFFTNATFSISCYILTVLFHSIFYVNLSYIYIKKNLHITVTILASWLTFIACEIIFEVFIGGLLLFRVFKVPYAQHYLSLINIYTYENIDKFWLLPIFGALLALASGIIVYFLIRNKEEVYIENDK